jgi:hypothetical protein
MIGANFNARRSAPSAIVKTWVRRHCSLGDDVTVLVAQLACAEPGCPPTETVISILDSNSTTSVRLHKPLSEVTERDIVAAFETTNG